jgi:hypothetical protein
MPGPGGLPCADCINLSALPGIDLQQHRTQEDVTGLKVL